VKNKEPFGLGSTEWSNSSGRGLKEQVELMLIASAENKVNSQAPKVIVEFTKSGSYEVVEELKKMSYTDPVTSEVYTVEVRGTIEPPRRTKH